MDPLLEGVVAAAQPCSLALVLPAAGVTTLAGRRGWLVAIACWTTASLTAWSRAAGTIDLPDSTVVGVLLAATALAGTALTVATPTATRPRAPNPRALAGGALVGVAGAALWQPCVGPALGTILTAAPDDPAGQLGPFAAYTAGLLLVTVGLAALPHLHPRMDTALAATPARAVAAAPLLLLVVVLATGSYSTVVGALVRASSLS